MTKKIKLYVSIPSVGDIADILPYALRDFEKKYGDQIEFVYPPICVHRKFHDFARNMVVEDFLATDCDILWFLDSDVVPPPHLLDLITKYSEHWELAGAPYPVFMAPQGYKDPQIVMCVYDNDGNGMHIANVPKSGTQFVAGLATGCIFVKREVFARLEKPYFEFKYNNETRQMTEGEDLGFCKKVNELGYQFFTDFSMVCGHYKRVNLLDVNNYAIQFGINTVKTYDAQIRPQIDQLVAKLGAAKPQKSKSSLVLPDHLK